jgi:hypothetical protein
VLKKMKFVIAALFLMASSPILSLDKLYLDHEQVDVSQDEKIRVHMGHNNWIQVHKIEHDTCGIYITQDSVMGNSGPNLFDGDWKCPYCYHWSPKGKRCRNPSCPSRNTEDLY